MIPRSTKPLKRTPVKKKRKGPPRRGRLRDPKYLDFVRTMPCVVCWGLPRAHQPPGICQTYWKWEADADNPIRDKTVESAHVGTRGLGQKCSDRETIPLCAMHHRTGPESHHVLGKAFFTHHKLDKGAIAIVAELNRLYELERK